MTETDYRLLRLRKKTSGLKEKKIAIYGTGENAKRAREELRDSRFVCFIDDKRTGEYISGYLVVSLAESLLIDLDIIIIAATAASTIIVENRIINDCIKKGIELWDIYGSDLISEKKLLMEQDLKYAILTEEVVADVIHQNTIICVEMDGVLFDKIDDESDLCYENIIVRKKMTSLIRDAVENGKSVYLTGKEDNKVEFYQSFVKSNSLEAVKCLILKDLFGAFSEGSYRECVDGIDKDNVLFVGAFYDEVMRLSLDYGMHVLKLKRIYDMIYGFTGAGLSRDFFDRCYSIQEKKELMRRFSSPFSQDIKKELYSTQCEKRQKSNKVLVISWFVPKYDRDAGSKTLHIYMKLLVEKGYEVFFLPVDFSDNGYGSSLSKEGITVLCGDYYRIHYKEWLFENRKDILFSFIAYPECCDTYLGILKLCGVKTLYYGIDLHFIRKQREWRLSKDKHLFDEAERYEQLEKKLVQSVDVAFYPSMDEVEIVKERFGVEARYFPVSFYDKEYEGVYDPETRDGIMYVGGFRHEPNVDAVKWFLKSIYPRIYEKATIPFYIVGSDEPKEIRSIQQPGIVHMGYVSEGQLKELYDKMRMIVIPLRFGAGVKGKVVDALYYGVPMVSTSIGIEGIPEAKDFIDCTDDEMEFADKVVSLYNNMDALKVISDRYKQLSHKYYSEEQAWNNIKEAL